MSEKRDVTARGLRMSVAEALTEVFGTKPDTETTAALTIEDRERLIRDLQDFGTSERAAAFALLAEMIRKAERDASLLDGRDHDPKPFDEALRLIALLKERNGDV